MATDLAHSWPLLPDQEYEPQFPSVVPGGVLFANEWSTGKDQLGWRNPDARVQRLTDSPDYPSSNDADQGEGGTVWATWSEWREGCGFCSIWIMRRLPNGTWMPPAKIVNRPVGGEHAELVPGPRVAISPTGDPAVTWSTFGLAADDEVFLWFDGRESLLASGREPDVCAGPGGVMVAWTGDDGQLYLMADDESPTPVATPSATIAPEATETPSPYPDIASPTVAPPGPSQDVPRWLALIIAVLLALLTGGVLR
jgi:hypothetical protein